MKRKLLLLIWVCAALLYNKAGATETEPNDTKAQANTLALNGSNDGSISTSTDVDWYKVTTNADGKLSVTLNVTNNKYLWCVLYDNDGVTQLAAAYTSGNATLINQDGLAAGTYYLKLSPYYSGDMPVYSISNTLTVPSQANDAEPNDSKAQAKVLPLNSSKTGHIDYYYNNHRDSADWYKVTTNADGRIRLTVASANAQNVWAYLFDKDGKTQLAAGYTSGTAVVVNKDGLAAGTYYIRVNTYYTNEFAPYTLSDSLFVSSVANDTEPDSTVAQALTLPLNGSMQGHVNYYYDNHKDSVDWYKVTTTADGRLRISMNSDNGQNVWAYLFDADGTTQLAAGYTSGNNVVVNKDGLAAGTYYIRVNTYYTNEWAPYTISDSLFSPTQANDSEPNDSRSQAKVLALNGSVTGHVNYYYNNKKDSSDWYKLTTTADGMITVTIQSNNGQNVWAYLFDNDGATLLKAAYSTSSTSYSFDGLKAGTYYIRVNTYYTSEWAPYTLSNTFTKYVNAVDAEPNDYFKQAKTLLANKKSTGHVGFYYNGVTDNVDYFKINYTANNGNLTLSLSQENRLYYNSADYTWLQVYSDTTASPIFSQYYTSSSGDINLTGLTKGYYYLKVFMYYSGKGEHFSSYSITNSFQQTKARISTFDYDSTNASCDSNWITYKLGSSHSPYTVQLYRFQTAYGNAQTTNTTKITFDSLPDGIYYATVYGDGATGNPNYSDTITIMPVPANLKKQSPQATQVKLVWDLLPCADYYIIRYKVKGTDSWKRAQTSGNVSNYLLTGLTPSSTYQWKIAAVDTENNLIVQSAFSAAKSFTTKDAAGFATSEDNDDAQVTAGKNQNTLITTPNPAINYFNIRINSPVKDKLIANLFDVNGKIVWTSGALNADALNGKQVITTAMQSGLYYLKVTDAKGAMIGSVKVLISK